jgi:putative flippase GtrA
MLILTTVKKFIFENKISILLFATIGTLTAVIYFSLFTLLWKKLGINYNIAISISYLSSITFYFFCNRNFTFKSTQNSVRNQLPRFIVMVLINYVITLAIVNSAVEILLLSPFLGVLLAVCATTSLSYLIAKFWVFQLKN